MKLSTVLVMVLALAIAATGMSVRTSSARQGAGVLDACERGKQEIDASGLPGVVDPARCPVGGRQIVDGAVKSAVPPPGEGVYAEVLTTSGSQELDVARHADGTIEVGYVGDDAGGGGESSAGTLSPGGQGECSDPAYTDLSYKVMSTLQYGFNSSTTPTEISNRAARNAIRRGASNIYDTRNACHLGDRVPVALKYGGQTPARAQVGDGLCGTDDGRSVVSFGRLRKGVLAATCTLRVERPSYDQVTSSDVKINKMMFKWTANPNSRSCNKDWDLESVMTHEWGHTFGLGHVSEKLDGSLTMSPVINGPCQSSERTLGRGDVLGLEQKYR